MTIKISKFYLFINLNYIMLLLKEIFYQIDDFFLHTAV